MKSKTKGLIVAGFFAVILLTSTLSLAMNNNTPKQNQTPEITITGTPADNFPDAQRAQFCGTGEAKSTPYVKEYDIPTACTQPLAIITDDSGQVYFAQTNTGKIAKFDPSTELFTEYDNPDWPEGGQSMIWGMDYSNGNVWYTDDANNSIWKFSTTDSKYSRIAYPTKENALPQKIKIVDNHAIITDFNEGKLSFYDTTQSGADKTYTNIPSPFPGSFVGGFDIDKSGNVWYTNWLFRQGGALVKFDYAKFIASANTNQNATLGDYSKVVNFPGSIAAPNGLSVDKNGAIWIADTDKSSFYKFTESDSDFTKYTTPDAPAVTYGNATGVIKMPLTKPYWSQIQGDKLFLNEQAANSIAVFDIEKESMVEYLIPSKNPIWGDCGDNLDCGIAQVFGFYVTGDTVWFTEWVENKIGKIDLTAPLHVSLDVSNKQVTIPRGQTVIVGLDINTNSETQILSKTSSEFSDITVGIPTGTIYESQQVPVSIVTSPSALPGTYKVALSARTADVTVTEFITIVIQ